jgi:type II secretion system (T2SS) protein E
VPKPRLGQILVADGSLSDNEIARALGYQRFAQEPFRIGSILLNWELIAEDALLAALAKLHHCPAVEWAVLSRASPEAIAFLTGVQAGRFEALPYGVTQRGLQVAFLNPSNLVGVDEVAKVTGRRVLPAVTTEVRFAQALHDFYHAPLPRHFRAIIQKLDRPKAQARETGDKRRPTRPPVAVAEEAASSVPAHSPGHTRPQAQLPSRPSAVRETGQAYAIPEIRVPDFPPIGQKSSGGEASERPDRERALDPIVEELTARLPRVIVFGVAESVLTPWAGRGPGVSRERLASLRIPRGEESFLAETAKSGVPHFGPVEAERFPRALGDLIQLESTPCALFPIRVHDAVAALLYADRQGDALPYEDFETLARAAASAANTLSASR